MKLHKASKIRGSKLAALLAVGIALSLFSVRAAELVLDDIRNISSWTQYKIDTTVTGNGGFRVKSGGTLLFNGQGAFANTFSGGVVVEAGGSLQVKQYNTTGTPFGSGPIEVQCTGENTCFVLFGNFIVSQTVTTTGNSSPTYPAFSTVYAGCRLHGVVVGGDLYMSAAYADAKNNSMEAVVFDFTEGLNAGSYDVGASVHALIRFQDVLTCGRLIGYYGVGTDASTLNGRLGGFVLSAANNSIGAIVLDGQFVKCAADGALTGQSLRFEGQHPCIGPEGYTTHETGILVLNANSSGAFTQTVKWIESDARARSVAAGYGLRNSSSSAATCVISGEANKTATAYANVNGKVNLALAAGAPATFRQVFMDRESTMNGTIAVGGGTLEVGGTATFASVPSMTVSNGAVVVSSTLPAFTGLTSLEVISNGSFTVASGAADPFTDFTADVTLGADAQLVIPAGVTLNLKSLTVDGQLLTAGRHTHDDVPQIVGGSVDTAQGATVPEQSITWTAGDATDPTDAYRGANWGLSDPIAFNDFRYLPTFASAGSTAVFSGRNRFIGMAFSAANGFAVASGSAGTDFLVTGDVTASGAATYSVEPPVTFTAANSISAGDGTMLRFDGGISSGFAMDKTGVGTVHVCGNSTFDGPVTISGGTMMLSGTVGGSGSITHRPETAYRHYLALSNATVNVNITQTGSSATMGTGINVPAGTESIVNGYASFSGSISFNGGGTTILAGGARFINKCYSYDGTVIVSNTPTTSTYGGVQSYNGGKWIFKVAGNTFRTQGGESLLVAYSSNSSIDIQCDNFMENPETMKWEVSSGKFELNGTRQTAKCIYSGSKNNALLTGGAVHGDAGSKLTLSGDTTNRIYVGSITGGLSLEYAGGEGGTLVLGGRDFTSTGSVAVTSGTLVLSNATWKAASEVWLTGGTLSIDQSDSFGKGRAPLYVKDGMLQVPADTYNYFSEAYLWDEGQGAYVRTGNGVFTAGATGLSAHLSGAGKVRVGKLGAMFTIR